MRLFLKTRASVFSNFFAPSGARTTTVSGLALRHPPSGQQTRIMDHNNRALAFSQVTSNPDSR